MRHREILGLSTPVCSLAKQAGEAILAIYDSTTDDLEVNQLVSTKADDSPLTLADLVAHQVIVNGLNRLYPGVPVVSEEDTESEADRVSATAFWLIDPLDGTKEFLARNGEFTVNIALVINGESVWGVVHAPLMKQIYWGGKSVGAWREGETGRSEIRIADWSEGATRRVVASRSHLTEKTSAFIERLGAVDLVQAGSSLKFCRIAEGAADIYPRLAPTCEWDTAAAQAIVEGAGGYVFDTTGRALRYGKRDVLNANFIAASVPFDRLPCLHD